MEAAGDGDHVSTHGVVVRPLRVSEIEAVVADHGARDHTGPMPAKVRQRVRRTAPSHHLSLSNRSNHSRVFLTSKTPPCPRLSSYSTRMGFSARASFL